MKKSKIAAIGLESELKTKRRIDSFEATHFLFSEKNNCNISVIARFSHSIPFSRLRNAVRLVEERNFLLRCGVSLNPLAFKETENLSEVSLIEKVQEEDWQSVANKEVHKLFDYKTGPLFRLCYLAGEQSNEIILSMHHSISDGVTLIAVLSEIIEYALNGTLEYVPKSHRTLYENFSIENFVLDQLNLTKPKIKMKTENDNLSNRLIEKDKSMQGTGFIYRSLKDSKFRSFFKKAQNKGVTFQSLFSAIVLKEFFHSEKFQKLNYTCPINIRKFVGIPDNSLGCKITLLEILIDKSQFLSYDELACFIDSKIMSLLSNRNNLLKNIFNLFSPCKSQPTNDLIRLGVSNVGKINFSENFDEIGIKSIYINGVLGNKFIFHPVVCTFQDLINIAFCFSNALLSLEEAQVISNNIVECIETF